MSWQTEPRGDLVGRSSLYTACSLERIDLLDFNNIFPTGEPFQSLDLDLHADVDY